MMTNHQLMLNPIWHGLKKDKCPSKDFLQASTCCQKDFTTKNILESFNKNENPITKAQDI